MEAEAISYCLNCLHFLRIVHLARKMGRASVVVIKIPWCCFLLERCAGSMRSNLGPSLFHTLLLMHITGCLSIHYAIKGNKRLRDRRIPGT